MHRVSPADRLVPTPVCWDWPVLEIDRMWFYFVLPFRCEPSAVGADVGVWEATPPPAPLPQGEAPPHPPARGPGRGGGRRVGVPPVPSRRGDGGRNSHVQVFLRNARFFGIRTTPRRFSRAGFFAQRSIFRHQDAPPARGPGGWQGRFA